MFTTTSTGTSVFCDGGVCDKSGRCPGDTSLKSQDKKINASRIRLTCREKMQAVKNNFDLGDKKDQSISERSNVTLRFLVSTTIEGATSSTTC